ncbi:hypothetical protein CDL12_20467 [Handroanthus impetiginosus]|uniref:Uncharacterized protein n=1 Tax=Handroanthus impetiginosus TaxID=429701 RepID=A0A2G9GNW3_9LAMI|nr:hypothetical protein CDL12_20467 [Handroanthus impetiginosus]
MKLKSCGNKHFIQAIRGGSVVKVHNTDSHGRPALSLKTLKEVYEGINAKTLQKPSSIDSRNMDAGPVSDHEHVKCEVPCLPVVERTLREIKPETDEFVWDSHSGSDSDLDDETTLKQLKDRFLKRKRKFSCTDDNSNLACKNENDSDLYEPIINLKLKNSRKSKAKGKCMKQSDVSSTTASDIKSEPNLVSEGPQAGADLAPAIQVKVEFPDAKELGGQQKPCFAGDSSIRHNEAEVPCGEVPEHREPLMSAEECLNCVTNEISYDHLEDREPTSVLLPSDGISVKLEPLELQCHEFLDLPPLVQKGKEIRKGNCYSPPSDDQNTDTYILSGSSSSMEETSEQNSSSAVQVPDVAVDCTTESIELHHEFDFLQFEHKSKADFPHEQDNSLSTFDKSNSFSQDSTTSLTTDDNLVSTEDTVSHKEEPLACNLSDIAKNGLNRWSNMEDKLLKNEEKQASAAPFTDAVSQSSLKNQTVHSAETVSMSEPHQPPERLLSTRKAISPSSQEQLRLVMNSAELSDNVDEYIGSECQGLLFEKQNGKKASSVRSDIQQGKITLSHEGCAQVSQRKVFISSRHITRKSPIVKVNVEGPRFSRSLPNPGTGCMSIQSCSESAIAFSQRQMQDMESLAMKLMNELKSMKDIVEQKLLFEAYRNVSLKNDADEVKSVINSATKMEETAQKWLSMMTRDCNRFCKIMKLTPNDVDAPKNSVPRERRKIMFADEAGGKLCHVKFFEDVTSTDSEGVIQ